MPRRRWSSVLLGLALLSIPYVALQALTGTEWHDDEGTLMIAFRALRDGFSLYDQAYGIYGPFYYLSIGSLFSELHVPLTHDVVRLVSAASRIGSAALAASLSFRLTRSTLAGVYAFLVTLFTLSIYAGDPLHPQELCFPLMLLLPHLLLSLEARKQKAAIYVACCGAIVAALGLTKINAGVFAGLALALALARAAGRYAGERWLVGLLVLAAMALTPALMAPLLNQTWAVKYGVFALLTILAALAARLATEAPVVLRPGHLVWGVLALGATAAIVVGCTVAAGSTPGAILRGTLLQNVNFVRNWSVPLPLPPQAFVVAGAAALIAGCYVAGRVRPQLEPVTSVVVNAAKLGVGVLGLALFSGWMLLDASRAGLASTFKYIVPFSFLLIVPATAGSRNQGMARACAGLLSAFLVLYPFPVAGDQVAEAQMLMAALLPLLVVDAFPHVRAWLPAPRGLAAGARRALALSASAFLLAAFAHQTWRAARAYAGDVPLDLPGARLVRVEPEAAGELRWLADRLAACPAFYTLPSALSLYFWTEQPTPTALNVNNPLGQLTPAQQERVIADLERQPALCLVMRPDAMRRFDRGQLAARPPLLRYIEGKFVPVAEHGSYKLLLRRND